MKDKKKNRALQPKEDQEILRLIQMQKFNEIVKSAFEEYKKSGDGPWVIQVKPKKKTPASNSPREDYKKTKE